MTQGKTDQVCEVLRANPDFAKWPRTLLEACMVVDLAVVTLSLELGSDPNVRSRPTPGAWRIPIGRITMALGSDVSLRNH